MLEAISQQSCRIGILEGGGELLRLVAHCAFFHSSWPAQHGAAEDQPRRPDRDQVVERDLCRFRVEPIHRAPEAPSGPKARDRYAL